MAPSPLQIANALFLDQQGLTEQDLENTLQHALTPSIDFADLYFQSSQQEMWLLEDSKIKNTHLHIDTGFGLRTIAESTQGLAYGNVLTLDALKKAANSARQIAQTNTTQKKRIAFSAAPKHHSICTQDNPLNSLSDEDKVQLLQRIDQLTRKQDPRITQVIVRLMGTHETILIANTDGLLTADCYPLVRLSIEVIAADKKNRESGSAGGGGKVTYELFTDALIEQYIQHATKQALTALSAKGAPAGKMPVVLGPGWPAVLFHEAVGHGLEADFNRKKSSVFWNRLNQQVATPHCTLIDDATLPNQRGSLSIDDEGTPGQRTVLIEDGILKNYLQDKLNATLMKSQPTGNGRRENYTCLPLPRMTNTFLMPGKCSPKEIIQSVDHGIYAADFSGGQVDITSGKFVFTTREAYLIENGKITHPVKNATLIGDGPDVLQKISMVGNDLAFDGGLGTCGKDGQSVPVGVGQPSLKIDEIIVGGTN